MVVAQELGGEEVDVGPDGGVVEEVLLGLAGLLLEVNRRVVVGVVGGVVAAVEAVGVV